MVVVEKQMIEFTFQQERSPQPRVQPPHHRTIFSRKDEKK